jgi:hypothetical protein
MPLNPLLMIWQVTALEVAGYSTWPSLAFSPSGQLAVAYHSSMNTALRYAVRDTGGNWAISTVDAANGDSAPSLKFRFDRPAISYKHVSYPGGDTQNPARQVRLALLRGSPPNPWSIDNVATGWFESSLAISPSRTFSVAYFESDSANRKLTHARSQSGSTWVSETADDDDRSGSFNSIAFTPSGQPAIAYFDSKNKLIKFAEFNGSQWIRSTIAEGSGWISLAFSPAGEPAVSYTFEPAFGQPFVMFQIFRGGVWNPQIIAPGDSSSLAFSPAGEPAISYRHRPTEAIKYAVYRNRRWSHYEVERTGKSRNGVFVGPFTLTSLGFSPSGQPAIAYYDRPNGTIRVAVGARSFSFWDLLVSVFEIGPSDPVTSYTNAGGSGDRTATITVSSNIPPASGSALDNWVDGNIADGAGSAFDPGFTTALTDGDHFTYDFGAGVRKYINEWKIYSQGTPANGAWQIQGSNDNLNYATYASFTWDAAIQTVVMSGMPAAGHRYWRMRKNGTPGGNYSNLWYREQEFKITAGA